MRNENVIPKDFVRDEDNTSIAIEAPYLVASPLNQSYQIGSEKKRLANFDMGAALRILWKNWKFAAICAAIIFFTVAGGTYIAYKKYPTYEADVRVQVDPPGSETFSLGAGSSSPMDNDYVDTQAQVLKSDELAVAAIRGLHLDQNPEIVGTQPCESVGGSPDGFQLSQCENIALRSLQGGVSVSPIKNTRVLELKFSSRDPRLAPTVANTLVTLFVEKNYKTRYEAVMKSSEWLERQLEDVRQKMVKSSQALATYERAHGIVDVDDKQSTVTQNISELNHQLTQSQADRIQLEPLIAGIQGGDSDTLPQVRDNAMIAALTQRSIEVQAELSEVKAVYGSQSPNVKKLENQASALNQQIAIQKQQIAKEVKNNYNAARSREKLIGDQLAKVTGQMGVMADYNNLKRDSQVSSDLYNTLYGRIKEAGIAAASKSSNVRVFDPARVLDKPTWPRPGASLMIGFVLSLFGGLAAAFAKGSFDTTIHNPSDMAMLTGSAVSLIPELENGEAGRRSLMAWMGRSNKALPAGTGTAAIATFAHNASSPLAEAIRSLQTTIMFQQRRGKPLRVILVVSPFAGEGKTTIAVNLAVALASSGKTCLVDADLRKSRIASSFNIETSTGLTDILRMRMPVSSPLVGVPDLPTLAILPGGPPVANPAPLILSKHMKEVINSLRRSCDFVVIDSPPLIPFADARALAPLVDGMVLVSRSGSTTREAVQRSMEVLAGIDTPVVSVVLNGANVSLPEYQYYV